MSVALKKSFKTKNTLMLLEEIKPLITRSGQVYVADHPITVDEFCDLTGEDDNVELEDGVIVERMATPYTHEDLFRFLYSMLAVYADKYKLGTILGSRTLVPIETYTGRLPDILFVQKERESIIEEKRLIGAPDLVIEILSPSDRKAKIMQRQSNYQQIGVKEFWIIDQPHKQIRPFIFDDANKVFTQMPLNGSILRSTVLKGFWINVDWLWKKPLPSVIAIFKEIAGDF
jgi:Uma2 family endonuclease